MAAETSFFMRDVYSTMGHATTRTETIPDAEDQNTLVDDQKLAEQEQISRSNPAGQHKNVMLGIGLIVIIIFVLGKV